MPRSSKGAAPVRFGDLIQQIGCPCYDLHQFRSQSKAGYGYYYHTNTKITSDLSISAFILA